MGAYVVLGIVIFCCLWLVCAVIGLLVRLIVHVGLVKLLIVIVVIVVEFKVFSLLE